MYYPFISIIVPVRNEEKNLPRLLSSISKLDYPKNKLEVIIVDGQSTDKTIGIARKFRARVFDNPKKIRGAGCQIGIKKARGKLVAFTDADCVVFKDWLIELIKPLTKDKAVSAGGPNITPNDDSVFAKAFGEVLAFLTNFGSRYGFSQKKEMEIFHNSGCNVLYKKQAILDVGGFNEKLITCEDEELDFRLRQKGYKLFYTPGPVVLHYRRPTYRKVFKMSYFYAFGRAQAIKIHFQMARWFHFVPSLLLLALFLPFFGLFSGTLYIAGFLFDVMIIAVILMLSFYLMMTKNFVRFYGYFFMVVLWLFGWGVGFIKGLVSPLK